MGKTPLRSMVSPSLILATEPGWVCAKKLSIIFMLETYAYSIAKKYKVSQPKEILHLSEGGLSGFAKEESIGIGQRPLFLINTDLLFKWIYVHEQYGLPYRFSKHM